MEQAGVVKAKPDKITQHTAGLSRNKQPMSMPFYKSQEAIIYNLQDTGLIVRRPEWGNYSRISADPNQNATEEVKTYVPL